MTGFGVKGTYFLLQTRKLENVMYLQGNTVNNSGTIKIHQG